ncbi:protein kinase domain-containing protein [Streptobacillus felis]|uniref:Phosphotransferase n=1 Tax=Streptobacillus felis TaxID=1384509 RepID=A0A7Z0PH57_9FUSO|nr:phosphotransferase [Streptobacillus felis]NYV28457.1 phosphotransferase [Streptobacillus felis]
MEINYYKKIFDLDFPENKYMFIQELNIMIFMLKNKISCIPKILKVNFKREYKEIFFEKLHGKTLNEIDFEEYNIKSKLILFIKILVSVKDIHDLGIVHNDINLGNIILNEDKVYIIDFTESRFIDTYYEKKYISYTKGFSSIEKYSLIEKNFKENDTYSLTSILYFFLFNKIFPDISEIKYLEINHDNKKIEKFLKKGLSFNKENRFSNISQMINLIGDIIEEL